MTQEQKHVVFFRDRILFAIIIWGFFESVIFQLIAYIITRFKVNDYISITNGLYYAVFGILLFCLIVTHFLNNRLILRGSKGILPGICLAVVLLLFLIYSNINYHENISNNIANVYRLFLFNIPLFILCLFVDDEKPFIDFMCKACIPLNFVSLYTFFSGINSRNNDESMTIGYMLSVCTIVVVQSYYDSRSIFKFILIIIDIISLVLAGCRGALLSLLIFILISFIRDKTEEKSQKKRVVNFVIISTFFSLIIVFYDYIMALVANLFSSIGISGRIVTLLSNGEIGQSLGRRYLYDMIRNSWSNMPSLGYGLFGDRMFLDGYYAHSLYYEIITDFGKVFGSILLVLLICLLIISIKNIQKRSITIIVSSYSISRLLFSSSYLVDPCFWIMLGVFLNRKMSNNKSYVLVKGDNIE